MQISLTPAGSTACGQLIAGAVPVPVKSAAPTLTSFQVGPPALTIRKA